MGGKGCKAYVCAAGVCVGGEGLDTGAAAGQ